MTRSIVTSLFVFTLFSSSFVNGVFKKCNLSRGFTVAEVDPSDKNWTYGCKLTTRNVYEYHFFSAYESSSEDNTIDVRLALETRLVKPDLRLYLVSFRTVHWQVTADKDVQLNRIRISSPQLQEDLSLYIDKSTVTLTKRMPDGKYYRGVMPGNSTFQEINASNQDALTKMESLGQLRSFTAVLSASSVTIPIGVIKRHAASIGSVIDSSGDETDQILDGDRSNYTASGVPTSPTDHGHEGHAVIIIVSVCSAVIAAAVFIVTVNAVRKKKHRGHKPAVEETQLHDYYEITGNSELYDKIKTHLPHVTIIYGNRLTVGSLLGQGRFGIVYEGYCTLVTGSKSSRRAGNAYQTKVAIKSIREPMDSDRFTEFLKECALMQGLRHGNVLELVGVCVSHRDVEGPLILVPFMENGDLKSYLSGKLLAWEGKDANYEQLVRVEELISFVLQICSGMAYLSSCSIIHRDLAARNCMLTDKKRVKIADFGMACFPNEDDYYRQSDSTPVPIRWVAPESVLERLYSEKSDVWSFGVTAWEVFSLGTVPYIDVPSSGIIDYLQSGERLLRPSVCPQELFDIIRSCWEWSPSKRDNFETLLTKLNVEYDRYEGYMTVEEDLDSSTLSSNEDQNRVHTVHH